MILEWNQQSGIQSTIPDTYVIQFQCQKVIKLYCYIFAEINNHSKFKTFLENKNHDQKLHTITIV